MYSLSLTEFAILLATDLALCGVGFFVFQQWTRRDTVPPVWFCSLMLVGAFVAYGLVARQLWLNADDHERFHTSASGTSVRHPALANTEILAARGEIIANEAPPTRLPSVLMFALAFWTIPVAYYTYVLLGSVGTWWVERRSWMEAPVPDPDRHFAEDVFDDARDRALSGDVVAAVGGSRTFSKKRAGGCLAAVRALEAEGRYDDAVAVLSEIAGQAAAIESTWAEATFRLGLIHERAMGKINDAVTFYYQVAQRLPDNEYGRMAQVALKRLRPQGDILLSTLDAAFDYTSIPGAYGASFDQPVAEPNPVS